MKSLSYRQILVELSAEGDEQADALLETLSEVELERRFYLCVECHVTLPTQARYCKTCERIIFAQGVGTYAC